MKMHRAIYLMAALALAALGSAPAQAGLIQVAVPGQDCMVVNSGGAITGGTGAFDSCGIFKNVTGQVIEISPVIAKYNQDGVFSEANSTDFPSISGSEFSVTIDTGGNSGSWTYTPGPNDPSVRYWSVKAANEFNLHWFGDAVLCADPLTIACLESAQVVTGANWFTAGNNAISHITFFDSEPPREVPAPGSLALLGLGLMGLAVLLRRRVARAK